MKDKHVIGLIENEPLANLSETDLAIIREHVAECFACESAFEAARLSSLMLRERAAEVFEPTPFFHTRVLAQLRERQAANESWSWNRIWRATAALASSMVATVVALAVLTFVFPENQTTDLVEATSARNSYSAEEVILNPGEDEQGSDAYVLTTLYDVAEESAK